MRLVCIAGYLSLDILVAYQLTLWPSRYPFAIYVCTRVSNPVIGSKSTSFTKTLLRFNVLQCSVSEEVHREKILQRNVEKENVNLFISPSTHVSRCNSLLASVMFTIVVDFKLKKSYSIIYLRYLTDSGISLRMRVQTSIIHCVYTIMCAYHIICAYTCICKYVRVFVWMQCPHYFCLHKAQFLPVVVCRG